MFSEERRSVQNVQFCAPNLATTLHQGYSEQLQVCVYMFVCVCVCMYVYMGEQLLVR